MKALSQQILEDVEKTFRYRPRYPEVWTIYKNDYLIVIHPDQRPKFIGRDGRIVEIEPIL